MQMHKCLVLTTAAAVTFISGEGAAYTTSLNAPNQFLDPAGWNVGDAGSTYQEWDVKESETASLPDVGYDTAGSELTAPTHGAAAGLTSSDNFYFPMGNYAAWADIINHGGGGGTHVIVQVGSSANPDFGTGTIFDSVAITEIGGDPIAGGANDAALQKTLIAASTVDSPFGEATYEQAIFEFFLANYTGDFRVSWTQTIHTSLDTLRVDTKVADQAYAITPIPEPASLALLGLGGLAMLRRR